MSNLSGRRDKPAYHPRPGDLVHVGERLEVYTVVSTDDLALVELKTADGRRLKAGWRTLVPADLGPQPV